jgi:dihydropteroate synthase
MVKVYVRPLEFAYGSDAKHLVKSKIAKKLCGREDISFSAVEVILRGKKIKKQTIKISNLNKFKNLKSNNFKKLISNLATKRKSYLGLSLNKPKLCGILNITPDSFSDGGKYYKQNSAIKHAQKLLNDGADIIDIGGESTRPGAEFVSIEEEKKRILNVIKNLKKFKVSADTRKAEIMIDSIMIF